jgi:hypothetical protein
VKGYRKEEERRPMRDGQTVAEMVSEVLTR